VWKKQRLKKSEEANGRVVFWGKKREAKRKKKDPKGATRKETGREGGDEEGGGKGQGELCYC